MLLLYTQTNAHRLQGRTLAAYALGRRRSAAAVAVSISVNSTPSMAEFRQGEVQRPRELYRGVFARRPYP